MNGESRDGVMLRGSDGTLYCIPKDQLNCYKVPTWEPLAVKTLPLITKLPVNPVTSITTPLM